MAIPNEYFFEGRWLTLRQIQAEVPCLAKRTVEKYIKAGRQTKREMLTYNPDAGKRLGGLRGAAKYKALGFDRIGGTKTTCGARA